MTPAPAALPPFDADQALRLARETFDIEVEALNGLAARVDGVFAQAVQLVLQAHPLGQLLGAFVQAMRTGAGLQEPKAGTAVRLHSQSGQQYSGVGRCRAGSHRRRQERGTVRRCRRFGRNP